MFKNEISSRHGLVRIDAKHGGRIFAELNGQLVHRWDEKVARKFDPVAFNNLGGNSLWPAPEGGPLAFNYLGGEWLVQPGVNTAESEMTADMTCQRTVPLKNNAGTDMTVTFKRSVTLLDGILPAAAKYNAAAIAYRENDELILDTPCEMKKAVIAAWSLEQFPGVKNIIAFGKTEGDPDKAVNRNFYGNPNPRLDFGNGFFKFSLGGEDRLQIGISAAQKPDCIGAFDPARSMLIVRKCLPGKGKRIDIADNDQPRGVFGADDQFSIFNGAGLDFFELETIAPMTLNSRQKATGSTLQAETFIFQAPRENLLAILKYVFGFHESFTF